LKLIKDIAKSPAARKNLLKKMWKKALKELKGKIKKEAEGQLQDICQQVANKLLDNAQATQTVEPKNFDTSQLDMIGIGPIMDSCSHPQDGNDRLACAKNIMDTLSNVDPTGLMAMATAFMQPVCDI